MKANADNLTRIGSAKGKLNQWADGELTGALEADVDVYVDLEALVRMLGAKAIGSRNGITKLQDGAIVLRVAHSGGGK